MDKTADQRLLELLDRWLKSLELHRRYASLDDDSYWKVQPWVEHQRPAPWIIALALEKTAALHATVLARAQAGDTEFAEALEQMSFLANLVGLQHIERFIPVADPAREQAPLPAEDTALSGTREMPQALLQKVPPLTPVRKLQKPAKVLKPATLKPATLKPMPVQAGSTRAAGTPTTAQDQVLEDAERLLQWGRRWFELPELIARMAERPPIAEIRVILNQNRDLLERRSSRS